MSGLNWLKGSHVISLKTKSKISTEKFPIAFVDQAVEAEGKKPNETEKILPGLESWTAFILNL